MLFLSVVKELESLPITCKDRNEAGGMLVARLGLHHLVVSSRGF